MALDEMGRDFHRRKALIKAALHNARRYDTTDTGRQLRDLTLRVPPNSVPRDRPRLLRDQQLTLHGQGQHVRNWLHVEDNFASIELILRASVPGEVYNIGGGTDFTNKALTEHILRPCGAGRDSVIYAPDRRPNDLWYSMTWTKLAALGYRPERDFEEGLAETIDWYRRSPDRWAPLTRNPHAAIAPATALAATGEEARAH